MRYVLEFFTIILPHPTKFCQYFILLIENFENFNLYSDEDGVKHIRIKSRPNKWHENDCPFCHKSCPAYDKHSSRPTTWRGMDWGGILVEVEYQTHRIICLEHGVYVAEVPWAYPGSRFTKDFDLTVAWYASYLPRSTTSYSAFQPCFADKFVTEITILHEKSGNETIFITAKSERLL